jgi:hypothetical protein
MMVPLSLALPLHQALKIFPALGLMAAIPQRRVPQKPQEQMGV